MDGPVLLVVPLPGGQVRVYVHLDCIAVEYHDVVTVAMRHRLAPTQLAGVLDSLLPWVRREEPRLT